MVNPVSNASSSAGPTFSGDVFLSIYSGTSASAATIPSTFDSSGVDAIVAAYRGDTISISDASRQPQREESSLTAAVDSLNQVQDLAFQMQDLAYAASDPFAPDSFRSALQTEFESLTARIQNIAATASYNGEKLFDGTAFRVQVGGGIDASIQAGGIDLQGLALDLNSASVSTLEGAFKAMDTLTQFSDRLVNQATRSIDSAEMRASTVRQSLESLLAAGGSEAAPSPSGALSSVPVAPSVAQMLQSYQGGPASQASGSYLLSLFA